MPEPVAVLGAGGWGMALAALLADKGHAVGLWAHDPGHARGLEATQTDPRYLPGLRLPDPVKVFSEFSLVTEARVVVLAVPSAHLRAVLEAARPFFRPGQVLVNGAKGLERESLLTLSQVVRQVLDPASSAFRFSYVALSGPSHAEEVARQAPTTVVAASEDAKAAARVQEIFSTSSFRVYTGTDLVGVELGGALKNVVALAAGISDGLGLGDNAKAALITRGLAEMTRLGTALGAKASTFAGLAGLGDLVVTCMSRHSRNRAVGEALGKGRSLAQIQAGMAQVAEGVFTASAAVALAGRHGVELPICGEVARVLFEGKPAKQALADLMARAPRPEEN